VGSPLRDLDGRLVVLTGANTGIGRSTALALADRGASLVLACRALDRVQPVVQAIEAAGARDVRPALLDLADFSSVRACAADLLSAGRPIDVLINNAGQAGHRGLTRDGFELAFGVNHLGHFLLTILLAPLLRAAEHARIVNVSSQAHYAAAGIDFEAVRRPTKTITGLAEYSVSKLANVLFTRELARRLESSRVHAHALHPGVVASDAWRRIPWPVRPLMKWRMLSPEQGSLTTLYCATSPAVADQTGRYYDECREKPPSAVAMDDALADLLWRKSVEFTRSDLG